VAVPIIAPWLEKLRSLEIPRSEILAAWGAITGSLALGWNILRQVRSKGCLKLEGIYQLDNAKPFLPPVFSVRVTNVGSKPVLVQGIAIQLKKGSEPSHHFIPCERPTMLARGKFFVQVIDRAGWIPTGARKLYAWDSSGKHWYLRRKEFRWLIEQHRRFIAAESNRVVAV
jgi:hypothetical protein